MESINEIKNRLQSLEDIKHLLRSVRAMSAIRWRRAKRHLKVAQNYSTYVDEQLNTLIARTGSFFQLENKSQSSTSTMKRNVGMITLTSDRGLCGNFNSGLILKAIDVTKILQRKNKSIKIISLGGYGERLLRKAGYEIFFSENISSSQGISFVNIRKVIAHIRALYESQAIHELNILYNQFNFFGSYTPKSIQILPPQLSDIIDAQKNVSDELMINSDPQELKSFLLWEHLASGLYLAYLESMVSEHSARLQTMDSAISNLDERMASLEIQYHTIRQEKITQEVLEVQSNLRERKGGE